MHVREDDVREREADRGRVDGVDARALQARNASGSTRLEAEAGARADGQSHAVDDEPEHRAQHRPRGRQPHRGEDAVQHRGALDHVPAREELDRRSAFELGALQRRRAFGRLEVSARGLFAATRPLVDGGQAGAHATRLLRRARSGLERHPEQARGVIERQLGDRLLRGPLRELGRAGAIAGSQQVHGDRLGVRGPGEASSARASCS